MSTTSATSIAENFAMFAMMNPAQRRAALLVLGCMACERYRQCPVGRDCNRNPRQLIGRDRPACPPAEGVAA